MKRLLLFTAALLLVVVNSFSQAGFNTGALKIEVNEYGAIELFTIDDVFQIDRASILVASGPGAVFDYQNDADVEEPTVLVTNPTQSDFEIYGAYNNAYSGDPPDVIVKLHAYGWNNGGYVIVKFIIKNNESAAMNAMAGLDVIPYIDETYGFDSVTYDATEGVIRFHRGNVTNVGMKLLSAPLGSLYSFEWYDDYSVDTSYWSWMNYGSIQPQYASNTADGPVTITSQAPVALNAGESFNVYYAMALGEDEEAMLNNIAAAEEKYQWLITSVDEKGIAAKGLQLGQNQPNPFRQNTTIRYTLPESGKVSLKVYNVIGNEVATLVDGIQAKGSQTVKFSGNDMPAGVYYCTLRANGEAKTIKMVVN